MLAELQKLDAAEAAANGNYDGEEGGAATAAAAAMAALEMSERGEPVPSAGGLDGGPSNILTNNNYLPGLANSPETVVTAVDEGGGGMLATMQMGNSVSMPELATTNNTSAFSDALDFLGVSSLYLLHSKLARKAKENLTAFLKATRLSVFIYMDGHFGLSSWQSSYLL